MQVPLLDLKGQFAALKPEIMAAMESLCDSQMFVLGAAVSKFEDEIAGYCGAAGSCGVSSGSDALLLALMAEGIGAGDEVITTPFTFFATVGAIARVGAKPVFADIDPVTFNIDPAEIEKKITPKTKAIIPVHLFGQMADMDPIMELAKAHNLCVIEDAAQAIGAEYKGKKAGVFGKYGCFSFFPSKNLGGFGDGGIITTDSAESLERLKIFRNHGMNPKFLSFFLKLKYLDNWHTAREKNAAEYVQMFQASKAADKIELPAKADYATRHIYNQFSIRVKDGKRDLVRDALVKAQIGCDIYYPLPLHIQECFADLGGKIGDFPKAEAAAESVLALPIYPESTTEMREYVVATIEQALA